jgi:hypothetical protein
MRRRLALLMVSVTALAVIGLSLALGASAKADILKTVHSVTARYESFGQAIRAGYGEFYECTEQPGVGTMGWHYVKGDLVGDPAVDPLQPEVLVYEPSADGSLRLVALEYVQLAPGVPRSATPPTVFGIAMKWTPGPENIEGLPANRYGLPNFYQLHYWLYQDNPAGTFADWNPDVSCRGTGDGGG